MIFDGGNIETTDELGTVAYYWYMENEIQWVEPVNIIRSLEGGYYLCEFEDGEKVTLHQDQLTAPIFPLPGDTEDHDFMEYDEEWFSRDPNA